MKAPCKLCGARCAKYGANLNPPYSCLHCASRLEKDLASTEAIAAGLVLKLNSCVHPRTLDKYQDLIRQLVKAGDSVMLAEQDNKKRIDAEWNKLSSEALQAIS